MMFSVLMSVYKNDSPEQFDASLESMLTQTYKASEILLIVDGPVGEPLKKIIFKYHDLFQSSGTEFNVHHNQENIGLALSLKEGLELTKFNIVARMDSDDICHPQRFEKQISFMSQYDYVYTSSREFISYVGDLEQGNIALDPARVGKILNYRNPIVHPSLMFNKKKILNLGGYRDFKFFEDYDLHIRVFNSNINIISIVEPLIFVRIGSGYSNRRHGFSYFKLGLSHKVKWFKEGNLNRLKVIFSLFPFYIFCMFPGEAKDLVYKYLRRVN